MPFSYNLRLLISDIESAFLESVDTPLSVGLNLLGFPRFEFSPKLLRSNLISFGVSILLLKKWLESMN